MTSAGTAGAAVLVEFMSLDTGALIFLSLWVIFVIYVLFSAAFRNLEKTPLEAGREV